MQLKHRLRQWGINKYISAYDMAIMGSLLQKHQMPGFNVRVLYKGHNVSQERIERACRRKKIVLPLDLGRPSCPSAQFRLLIVCTVQPSHIEIQTIPVSALSQIAGTFCSPRGHSNKSVIENRRTNHDILRPACRRSLYTKVQDDDNTINNPDLGPIILENGDAESLILPLELCKSRLIRSLDHPLLQRMVIGEPVLARLIKLLQSQWLLGAMDELLCWAYGMAASSFRQLLGASHDFDVYSVPVKKLIDKRGIRPIGASETRKNTAASLWQATSRSQLLVASSTGTLNVRYSSVSGTDPGLIQSERLLAFTIAFMPRSKERTIGVSIMFSESQDTVGAQKMSPYICAFNVIPKDSAIIKSVLRNDLEEVRNLFASGEASPLDVDPDGFSLLSVHDQYEHWQMWMY